MRQREILLGAALAALAAGSVASAQPAGEMGRAELALQKDGQIYALMADGSGRRPITQSGSRARDTKPAWSPDGTHIAITREVELTEEDDRSQIQLLHADGSARRSLTPLARGVSDNSPRWSPDCSRLAFARFVLRGDRGTSSIVVHDLRTGAERNVASQRLGARLEHVAEPDWSPDGRLVVYTRSKLDSDSYFSPSLYLVGVDGTERRLLAREAQSAAFSPDGAQIAFAGVRDQHGTTCGSDECSYNGELYVMDASGTNLRRLTRNRGDDTAPSWSPDGGRIAFSSNRNFRSGWSFDTGSELYSVRPDGSCLTWLTNGTAESSEPDWRPGIPGSSDPGGCGATPRGAIIEVDLRKARRFGGPSLLWLGRTFRGLLLTYTAGGRGTFAFGYEDCGRYDPRACPATKYVQVSSVCSADPYLPGLVTGGGRLLRRRGTLVVNLGGEGGLNAYTGGLVVHVISEDFLGRGVLAAFRGLRPFPRETVAGRLRAPALPRRFVRSLRRIAAEYRRLGSVGAVGAKLGLSHARVSRRLAIARVLRPFGRVRTVRCR